jgi:hypothetical protein
MPAVRAPVAEMRHDCRDARCSGAAAGIRQREQFDQAIVSRRQVGCIRN